MSQVKHSLMAERVAIGRAAHQFLDPGPLIFPDPLARRVIGADGERWMQRNLEWLRIEGMRRTRVVLALRSRFAEDELLQAMVNGTRQYVVLGAGLDTFAYRRVDLADRLTVYEVDRPATQQWKHERLAEADIEIPPHVRFVAVDFNERSLAEGLAAAGFQRDAPAFFSWLGVTYYLPQESVHETLRFIGAQRGACQVVFDYAVDASALASKYQELITLVQESIASSSASEQWTTCFAPAALAADLRAMGFTETTNIEANELLLRYTGDTTDDLTPLVAVMSALA